MCNIGYTCQCPCNWEFLGCVTQSDLGKTISDDLFSSFLECAKDTLSASTGFGFEALRQKKNVEEVISTEQKARLLNTIAKINDLSWPVLLHAIGFFNSLINLDLPLKPSNKLLPKVCSLWNRLKNGSYVVTMIIRSNCFPLPTTVHQDCLRVGYAIESYT